MITSSPRVCSSILCSLMMNALCVLSSIADESSVLKRALQEASDTRPRSERILTDDYFFEPDFAAQQLQQLKDLVERKDRLNFVTTGRFKKKPKLVEMTRRYGAPDLVVATREFYAEGEGAKSYTVTAFYDRVGFSVYGKHQRSQTVHLVTLQYHDFTASLRPKKGKYFYEVVTTKNRVFYSDGQEVGLHVYTDRMAWDTLGGIPAGEYTSIGQQDPYAKVEIDAAGSGKLIHYYPNGSVREEIHFADGKYHGVYKEFSEQGWVSHRSTYEHGRMHGVLHRFYENGMLQAEANYYHGRIHGRAKEFHPNGTVRLKMDYSYGNPLSSLEEYDESGKLVRSSAPQPAAGMPEPRQNRASAANSPTDEKLRKSAVPAS